MVRTGLRPLTGLLRCRWLRLSLWTAGWPLLGWGCTAPQDVASHSSRMDSLAHVAPATPWPSSEIPRHANPFSNEVVQASQVVQAPELPSANVTPGQPLPIDLDTVLHLAEEQNTQIALAREQLHESQVAGEAGLAGWLPKITAGMAYYRHEGGIQNPDGTFVQSSTGAFYPGIDLQGEIDPRNAVFQRVAAERQRWQKKGDLSKVTNEVLLESATTYIDLLAARCGEAIGLELESYAQAMLKRAEDLKKSDPSASVLFEAALIDVIGRRQARSKLHQQADAAAAKLGYLLGLPPETRLTPVEAGLASIDLVDVSPATKELVERALTTGPGVQEIQGLLSVIQAGMAQLEGPIKFMPTFQLSLFEGPFGAGPDSSLTFDNRFDAGLQVRWNLTEWLNARQKKREGESKLMQVQLAHQDLCAKLAASVDEARQAILAGREQMYLGEQQLLHANEAYRISNLRVKENAPGATITEVLQAIQALQQAHMNYLSALSAHNKAEIRLLLLLGPCQHKKVAVTVSSEPPVGNTPPHRAP
jgi:outer membrane protein TolC